MTKTEIAQELKSARAYKTRCHVEQVLVALTKTGVAECEKNGITYRVERVGEGHHVKLTRTFGTRAQTYVSAWAAVEAVARHIGDALCYQEWKSAAK